TSVGKDGKWCVEVKTPKSAGMTWTVTVKENKTLAKTFKNVLLGEVWICSGQSNMFWPLSKSAGGKQAAGEAADDQLRLILIPLTCEDEPQTTHGGSWAAASPKTTHNFSAVGYHYGCELRKRYKCPIGLIQSAWGGSRCEAWITTEGLIKGGFEKKYITDFETAFAKARPELPRQMELYKSKCASYRGRKRRGQLEKGEGWPKKPWGSTLQHRPRRLYNGMIHPIVPLKVAGVIWYQGESNTRSMGDAKEYATLFPVMINDWRRVFKNDKMKFLWAQLANFKKSQTLPAETDHSWAELQFSQTATLTLSLTGQAVISDIGMGQNVHPKNKLDVAKRLAAIEERLVKDPKCKYRSTGPMLVAEDCKFADGKTTLKFAVVGEGLKVRGDGKLRGFSVCGKDGKWTWATAEITGKDTVEVTAPEGVTIARVCYNWADNPVGNLTDSLGHPAGLFRTK
ncbi:MAG: sialate O-acetylesterase, partial [Phycisphaerales bacterium]|nr:sialate O-acetylesterase [Phycisphaerales bacterium]